MLTRIVLVTILGLLLLSILITNPLISPVSAEADALAIIVNKANPVDNLSSNDLRKILVNEQQEWPNGRKIQLVMREPGQPERDMVLRVICKMNENDYSRSVIQASFNGESGAAPKLFPSAAGIRRFVSNLPGAIGYVFAKEGDDTVKVLKVDGLTPDQAGYKLK